MFHITCKAKSNIFSPAINRFKIWLKPTSSYQPLPFEKWEVQLLRRFTWIKCSFPVASCSSGCCVDWPLERPFSESKTSVCVCVCVCVCGGWASRRHCQLPHLRAGGRRHWPGLAPSIFAQADWISELGGSGRGSPGKSGPDLPCGPNTLYKSRHWTD